MGARFADEIRKTDKEVGIPSENRSFTYRAHYNTVEQKCFVLTEGSMSVPFQGGTVFLGRSGMSAQVLGTGYR
jgi:hypothetical protein